MEEKEQKDGAHWLERGRGQVQKWHSLENFFKKRKKEKKTKKRETKRRKEKWEIKKKLADARQMKSMEDVPDSWIIKMAATGKRTKKRAPACFNKAEEEQQDGTITFIAREYCSRPLPLRPTL